MISGDDAAAALARVDALHTALTDIVLEGGDLDRIAAEVGKVLDVAVLFTSTDGRERASAIDPVQRAALDSAGLIDGSGRVRVEQIAGDGSELEAGQVRSLRVAATVAGLAARRGIAPWSMVGTCTATARPTVNGMRLM